MILSIWVCLAALGVLLWLLRKDQVSLGIPFAYLAKLVLLHVPGALPHALNPDLLYGTQWTETGIRYTAIGAACFVGGVWLTQSQVPPVAVAPMADRKMFSLFCLVGGWLFVYGLSPLHSIPSVGAIVDEGGAIWILGVMLGLRSAIRQGNLQAACLWFGAVLVYPVLMLLLGGFLGYGATTVIFVGAALAVSVRSYGRLIFGLVAVGFLGLSLFVSYFHHRDAIRNQVWGGAVLTERINSVTDMFTDFRWFDPTDPEQADSLDIRLNQNFFVGLAAQRLDRRQVDYLYGRSIWEGVLALVPRALWPEKPVSAGSGNIVADMTGLELDKGTSWGVGNVMEFDINYGIYGIIFGFLGLGWLIGFLDRKAAMAERSGDLGRCILYFLPAVALADPGVSIAQVASGAAASLLAAYVWREVWAYWARRGSKPGIEVHGREQYLGKTRS